MLRKAEVKDIEIVMEIINDARKYLKNQNSLQWNQQDGYPTKDDLLKDIKNESCYLFLDENLEIGVMSIIYNPDENYEEIDGTWLTNNPYASIHRMAISNSGRGKGFGVKMLLEAEKIIKENNIYSIKIDTHKMNIPMSKTILKAGYKYCGIIKLKRNKTDNLRDGYEKKLTE